MLLLCCPFSPVLCLAPFPKKTPKSPRRPVQVILHQPTSRSLHWSPQREWNNLHCDDDVRPLQMSVCSLAEVIAVHSSRSRRDHRSFSTFTEVIAIHSPHFVEGSLAIHSSAEKSPFARSPKDVHLHCSLASPKGTPIAHQKDVQLQEVKNPAVNRVLPKKLLRT